MKKKVERLSYPYGDCVDNELARGKDYIYENYEYSVEVNK
jgi:hypothetical protein